MRPDIKRRKRGPGQGSRASENHHSNAHEYRRLETGVQAQVVDLDDFRFQRAVAQLHCLGPCPMVELLVELGARHLLRTEIEAAVNRHAVLDPVTVEAVGGGRFAPAPLHEVMP